LDIWTENWVSSCLSLFPLLLHISTFAYIFAVPTCATTIISLELCPINAEFQSNFIILRIPLKEGIGGFKQAQRQGDFMNNFIKF
jgi:hypothetical protein